MVNNSESNCFYMRFVTVTENNWLYFTCATIPISRFNELLNLWVFIIHYILNFLRISLNFSEMRVKTSGAFLNHDL